MENCYTNLWISNGIVHSPLEHHRHLDHSEVVGWGSYLPVVLLICSVTVVVESPEQFCRKTQTLDTRKMNKIESIHSHDMRAFYYTSFIANFELDEKLSNMKSLRQRKSSPQMLAAWKVIRSASVDPIFTIILLVGGLILFGGGDRPRGELESY